MTVLNDLDRFYLVIDVVDRVDSLDSKGTYLKQLMRDKLIEHEQYITEHSQGHAGDSAMALAISVQVTE